MIEYIERGALINDLEIELSGTAGYAHRDAIIKLIKKLAAIPAADVEPVVRATWVEKQAKNYNEYYPDGFRCTSIYTCSNCGKKSKTKHARCLHCFAHMERSGSGE